MKKKIDILFYWVIIGSIVPNILLSVTEPMTVVGRITNILLPLGILGLLVCTTRHIGRVVLAMLPYSLFAAFQIVLLSLYGNGIISVDMFLNVVTTNSTEVSELLGRLGQSLLVVSVLYLIPLVLGGYCIYHDCTLPTTFLKRHRLISSAISIIGAACLICSYGEKSFYDIRRDLFPVNIGYNLYLTFVRCEQTRNYYELSDGYEYRAETYHDVSLTEKYILVIGESARAPNWQMLGYERATNPRLLKRDDLIVAPKAFSESNTTHKSVPMLMSNVDARTFDTQVYRVKSLITAFKECGYHTTFISNQMPNHSYIDFFGSEADTSLFVRTNEHDANAVGDDNLLPYVKGCLDSNHKKQLIVVHTYGSHFNYLERYSAKDRMFYPDKFPKASKKYRKELENAYDNSIVATDRFLNSVVELLEDSQCVSGMLYASDHGEDIFDDGIHFLHASPTPTVQQLHVPMVIWLSKEYVSSYPEVVETLKDNSKKYISTSRSVCPTAMSVAGIGSEKIDSSDALTSTDFKSKPLFYLDDHNRPLPFKPIEK